jgi:hypothetical protein
MNAFKKKKVGMVGLYSGLLLISLSILGFIYLNELKKYPNGVNPPLEIGMPYTKIMMNSQKAFTYHAPSGTTVFIPANAVITKNGKPVKGKITLQFREFQNADEIALSGIPMQFGPDRTDYFSSAGMMELRAFQGEEELVLAKEVTIELAAPFEPDVTYKLYKLQNEQEWDEGKSFKREKKVGKTERIGSSLKPKKSKKEHKEMIKKQSLTNESAGSFEFELVGDPVRMPHLKSWEGVTWRLLSCDTTIEPSQALRFNWDMIDIAQIPGRKGTFDLKFSKESLTYSGDIITTNFSMVACPNLKEADLSATIKQFDEDIVAFNDLMVNVRNEEGRKNTEASIISKFTISSFGIYNIDKLKNLNQAPHIALSFDFEDQLIPELNHVVLYMVMKDERSVFSFNAFEWDEIPYVGGECYFFAVLPGKEVAYISAEQIKKKLGTQKLSNYVKNEYHFKTERLSTSDFVKLVLPKDGESTFI